MVWGCVKILGMKVNEWGVFRVVGDEDEYIVGVNEDEVY